MNINKIKDDCQDKKRICINCDKEKQLSLFIKYWKTSYSHQCKDCKNNGFEICGQFEADNRRKWKICSRCREKKELSNFRKDGRFDLYISTCNRCIQDYNNELRIKKRKTDKNYQIKCCIWGRIKRVLYGKRKSDKSANLLNCTIPYFLLYIESKFTNGMTWKNRGYGENKWTFDHILPCELFDLSDARQQRVCFNYKNIQPMWSIDNSLKSDKLSDGRYARDLTPKEKLLYLKSIGHDFTQPV